MAKRSRTVVVATLDPTERARIERIETFFDPNVEKQ
jgi:hypothetical protein